MESSYSMMPIVALGVLETAINTVVTRDGALLSALSKHAGKVVRVKVSAPDLSLYILFCTDGIQVLSQFDGHVDARIRAPAVRMMLYLLTPAPEPLGEVNAQEVVVSGNHELIVALNQLMNEFNVWQLLHQLLVTWIPDPLSLTDLLDALHRADPIWVDKLQTLLQAMERVNCQLAEQTQIQKQQLQALVELRKMATLQQQRFQLLCLIGFALLLLGVLNMVGAISLLVFIESIGLLNCGLILGGGVLTLLGLLQFRQPRKPGLMKKP